MVERLNRQHLLRVTTCHCCVCLKFYDLPVATNNKKKKLTTTTLGPNNAVRIFEYHAFSMYMCSYGILPFGEDIDRVAVILFARFLFPENRKSDGWRGFEYTSVQCMYGELYASFRLSATRAGKRFLPRAAATVAHAYSSNRRGK